MFAPAHALKRCRSRQSIYGELDLPIRVYGLEDQARRIWTGGCDSVYTASLIFQFGYSLAITCAKANASAVCPEGNESAPEWYLPSAQNSPDSPDKWAAKGRTRLLAYLNIVVNRAVSAIASAAKKPVSRRWSS